ncbi:MAG: DUF3231 family protein [Peptococcaceae bacterium]|nr:DUF3231 family protein [Peptococcaceae bacterium]
MVQIGNFHIGRYDSAHKPVLSSGEGSYLWEILVALYDWNDTLEILVNYAYDQELIDFLRKCEHLLNKQTKILEDEMAHYQVPLPERPRKAISFDTESGVINDDFIFRRIFTSSQNFLLLCSGAVKISVVSESLRETFLKILLERIEEFDEICKFGRKKGWLQMPPKQKIN